MLSDKHVKAKAAETHGLLAFVCEILAKYKALLSTSGSEENQLFFELATHAGQSALAFDAVMARHGRYINAQIAGEMLMHYDRFIVLCSRAGFPLLPKAHLMYHCIQRSVLQGNPRTYSTYADESYNGAIARVCRSVHRRGWAWAVYRKLSDFGNREGGFADWRWHGLLWRTVSNLFKTNPKIRAVGIASL